MPRHKAVAEIKDLVKQNGVKITAHWIRAHVGHQGNERAEELAKAATECLQIDVVVKLITTQAKKFSWLMSWKAGRLAGTIALLVAAHMRSFFESPLFLY